MPEKTPEPDEFGWLRVADQDTGHKRSVRPEEVAHGNYVVLKDPASNPVTGDPLPPELNATKPLSSTTTSGPEAETKKEKADG